MKLKKMKRPVLILLTLLTVFALAAAQAEVTAVDTEANGKVTQTVWMDSDGSIVPGPQGYAMVRYEYKGAEKTETYYDAEGQPYESAAGCYGRKVTVDGKKRIIQIDYLGADGSRTLRARRWIRRKAMPPSNRRSTKSSRLSASGMSMPTEARPWARTDGTAA